MTHALAEVLQPDIAARQFYADALRILDEAAIPYVIGGAYAMAHYTSIVRHTKDMDLFVREEHVQPALDAFEAAGYRTEMTWPHFLGKAIANEGFVDLLFNSGNGISPVDDDWFTHAEEAELLGRPVRVCPPEEMIWSKAFVQDRDRYDGADVAHLLLARASSLDWDRMLRRFAGHERVLLSHLLLFGYVYPSERRLIPCAVIEKLAHAIGSEPLVADRVCRGTLLASRSYLHDVEHWDYADARLHPHGTLTPEHIQKLTP